MHFSSPDCPKINCSQGFNPYTAAAYSTEVLLAGFSKYTPRKENGKGKEPAE